MSRSGKTKARQNNTQKNTSIQAISPEEQLVLNDERVQAKLKELEDKEASLKEREKKCADDEKSFKDRISHAEEEIRTNEQKVRGEEYAKLKQQWDEEENSIKAAADADRDEAHKIRLEAESIKNEKIKEAQEEIEKRYNELNSEFEKKESDLRERIKQFKIDKENLNDEIEDLEYDKAVLQEMKKKYQDCSPNEVARLKARLDEKDIINKANVEIIQEQSERIAKLQILTLNASGESYTARIEQLEAELKAATDKLNAYSNLPSEQRVAELVECEKLAKTLKIEVDELNAQLLSKDEKIRAFSNDKRALDSAIAHAKALESMNNQLREKFNSIAEQYKTIHESKFQGLLEIDKSRQYHSEREPFRGNLKDLVQYVRMYGAMSGTGTPLYYSEETIRVFISSLATAEPSSRLIILQGLSGTGKSSLPELFHKALDIKWQSIAVQPSWRDNRELLGYDNDFTNRFKETEFTKALYTASLPENRDDICFIVLDEMNLARIEYYFADFLSELEHRNASWKIPLISSFDEKNNDLKPKALNYDNGTANLCISKNIWFIGTANNDDSTSLITDKVYDRAQILDMDNREDAFQCSRVPAQYLSATELKKKFDMARSASNYLMSPNDWKLIQDLDMNYLQKMDITFGNRMKNQLSDFVPVYQSCGGSKGNAIDYFLSHKILRKLDEKYDAYIADELRELKLYLSSLVKYGEFNCSIGKIDSILKRNFEIGEN